ncbi:hypothetical protein MMC25_002933 [Agyrium rufum]|nr:hypothetical protein [Agyrium rufum]
MVNPLLFLLLPSLASAVNLYVSSYAGTVTTLSLTSTTSGSSTKYALSNTATNYNCLNSPSWLLFNSTTRALYCVGEGISSYQGSISTFTAQTNGQLTQGTSVNTVVGGVNSVQYSIANGSTYLAVAHYTGSALSTWVLKTPTTPTALQQFKFSIPHPGPNPARQDAPHPHEVLVDPTGQFILAPDLGMDLIHVYAINQTTALLSVCPSINVTAGSGPRHATFVTPPISPATPQQQSLLGIKLATQSPTYMYLVSELVNTVTAFNISYSAGCLQAEVLQITNSFGPQGQLTPYGTTVAEIHSAQNHLLVSNRGDNYFLSSNSANTSDSMSVFSLDSNGDFVFQQLSPAGGSFPRDFTINKAGNLVAVGLQYSNEVAIITRSEDNGSLQQIVAKITVPQNVTCVVWDE